MPEAKGPVERRAPRLSDHPPHPPPTPQGTERERGWGGRERRGLQQGHPIARDAPRKYVDDMYYILSLCTYFFCLCKGFVPLPPKRLYECLQVWRHNWRRGWTGFCWIWIWTVVLWGGVPPHITGEDSGLDATGGGSGLRYTGGEYPPKSLQDLFQGASH